jgi:glutamine synthetase
MNLDEVCRVCTERDIHTVECAFPDAHGILRGKRIPVQQFLDRAHTGFDIANAALIWNRTCDVLQDVEYANFDTGYPDMSAVADLSTFRPIPWRPGSASVLCSCHEHDGSDVSVSTRSILAKIVDEARGMGYEPMVAAELEFYILDRDGNPLYPKVDCYSLTRGATLERFLEPLRRRFEEFGISIEACNTEYGPAQVEVNIRYADAIRTADNAALFRAGVREMAEERGLRVSFMAKPYADQSGSGFHVHQSLAVGGDRRNLFAEAGHDLEGSPVLRRFLAGLLAHIGPFTALGSPAVNDYKRVAGYTFAPVNVCWGIDNRTVAVRAIVGHGAANRLEWRNGAAHANPYVVIAACLAAGLDGIRQELEPAAAVEGDAYARTDLALLPETLEQALDALAAHEFASKVFGDFLPVFLAHGRHELALWRSAVTDWERARYLDA